MVQFGNLWMSVYLSYVILPIRQCSWCFISTHAMSSLQPGGEAFPCQSHSNILNVICGPHKAINLKIILQQIHQMLSHFYACLDWSRPMILQLLHRLRTRYSHSCEKAYCPVHLKHILSFRVYTYITYVHIIAFECHPTRRLVSDSVQSTYFTTRNLKSLY